MATLKPRWTWYNDSKTQRSTITRINIVDSFSPTGTEKSWSGGTGVTCYIDSNNVLTIAGDGSGSIKAAVDASYMFAELPPKKDENGNIIEKPTPEKPQLGQFENVTVIEGAELIDVSSTVYMEKVFERMINCKSVDVSNWNTSKVTNMHGTFSQMYKVAKLAVDNWDVSHVTDTSYMFQLCVSLPSLNLSKWNPVNLIDAWGMFQGHGTVGNMALTSIGDTSNWDLNNLACGHAMFSHCPRIEHVYSRNWGLSKLEDAGYMFYDMYDEETGIGVKHIDCEDWNLTSVKNIGSIFSQDKILDFPKFKKGSFKNCTDFSFCFHTACVGKPMDFSNWDVENAENLDHFTAHSKSVITGVSEWKCPKCINFNAVFHGCANEILDLRNLQVNQALFLSQMFENSSSLKRVIGVENWIGPNCVSYDEMFARCSSIEEIIIPNLDTRKAKDGVFHSTNGGESMTMHRFFWETPMLRKVTVGANFSWNGDGSTTNPENRAILPAADPRYIPDADDSWYGLNGERHGRRTMPQLTAGTYYASKVLAEEETVMLKNKTLIDIAEAIRAKNGSSKQLLPSEFADAIRNIK